MKYLLRNVSLLALAMLFFTAHVFGQQTKTLPTQGGLKAHQHFTTTHNVPHQCGSSQVMNDLISQSPALKTALQNHKKALPSLSKMNSSSGSNHKSPPILTIPVVVHIIHQNGESIGTGQNLSITQIQNQIDVLNERFRLQNTNFSNTPTQFQTVASDPEIEFCLANIDPNGGATNGITRTVMSASTINGIEDTIKPATNWDPSLYLNIWSVPIPGTTTLGGILGYSYLPGVTLAGIAHEDGVVIDYRWFGTGAGVSGDGLTGVHEVGHYLGLLHTWGDDNANGTPIGCSSDDGIADTPDQAAPTGLNFAGCPSTTPTSCGTSDMYVNYMDYVNDPSCQTMFTQDQVNVMRSVLNGTAGALGYGDRSTLINNATTACSSPCAINLTTGSTPENCSSGGLMNGTATVSPSGGTPPYAITWSTTPTQTSGTASGLSAGTYTVTVTDVTNCAQTATVTVDNSSTVTGNFTTTAETCAGFDGTATVVPSGGTAPYFVQWSDGQTTTTATGLETGVYGVAISDLSGCVFTDFVFVGDDCIADCDTITNFDPINFTPTLYSNPFGAGFVSGTNSFGDLAKADYYDYQGPHTIVTGAVLAFGAALSSTPTTSTLEVVVWDGTGGTPGVELGSELVTFQTIATDISNGEATVVQFSTPVNLNSSEFFVGFRIPQNSDIIGIATSEIGDVPTGFNRAWEQWSTGDWYAYDVSWGEELVHAIGVELGLPPTAGFTPSNVSGCDSSTIAFTSTSLDADIHEWLFPGGTPSSSNMVNPSVTYDVPGTYDVTLVVHNGCVSDTMFVDNAITITSCQAACTMFVDIASQDVSCNGGTDGTATATPMDGVGPYTYVWSTTPAQTSSTVSNLLPGNYMVTVTDNTGCVVVGSVMINEPDGMQINITGFDETCINDDGMAIAEVTGGTAPYTYSWNSPTPSNSDTASGLPAGTYIVTVVDANSCVATESIVINDACIGCNLTITSTVVSPTCNGDLDGSIAVTPSLGTGLYSYFWTTGSTDSMITGLGAGSYKVIVFDEVNCVDSVSFILTEPDALTVFEGVVDESCAGNDGQAIATVQGGTAPYTYVWNTVPPQTTSTIVGLAAGTYEVTITDASGCMTIQSIDVANICPCGVAVATSSTDETCLGNDGTATAIGAGPNAPFTYNWSTGDTGTTISGLAFGIYEVTVTDTLNCATSISVTVNDGCNCGMVLSGSATGESCDVGADGTATVEVDGLGTAPYTFAWSTNPIQIGQTAFGLSAGLYTVTVTDATNCSQTLEIDVPGTVAVSISQSNASCNLNNGSLTAMATGGNAPYTYLWSIPGTTTQTVSGLGTGNYSVTVIDADGCTATATAVLVQNGNFVVNAVGVNSFCSINGASAQAVAINGGTVPFDFSWSNGDTTAQINSLPTGVYTVTVTDNNGCVQNGSVNVTSIPSGPVLGIAQTNVSCAGGNDGAIDMTVTAGTPVQILWSTGVSSEDINGLGTGSYTVIVTDLNGCIASTTVTITEPTPLTVNGTSTATVNNDGTASANISGGTPPYTYSWSTGGMTQTIMNLIPGLYTVTVTDDNGCSTTTTVEVQQFTGVLDLAELQEFNLFPNPTNGQFMIDLSFVDNVDADITIYNAVGQQVFTHNNVGKDLKLPVNLNNEPGGIYFVMVTTATGRAIKRVVLAK